MFSLSKGLEMKKFILFSWFFILTSDSGSIKMGPYETYDECLEIRQTMIDRKAGTVRKCKEYQDHPSETDQPGPWSFSWDNEY